MNNANLTKALTVVGVLVLGYGVYNYVNNRKNDTTLNNTTPPANPNVLTPIDETGNTIDPTINPPANGGTTRRATGNAVANNFYSK